MQQYALDDNARLEFGLRIKSTQASYRELEQLLGADQKVEWARTAAHPNKAKFFQIPVEINQNGKVIIPNRVIDAFTRYGGFMMVKLVTPLPIGHYANLAKYTDDGHGKLWGFDLVAPRRDNGDWVYSMPIHGLEKAGEGYRFFFAIRLDLEADGNLTLLMDKITITRGKEHFTVSRKSYGPLKSTSDELLISLAEKYKDGDTTPLKGLQLREAIQKARTTN